MKSAIIAACLFASIPAAGQEREDNAWRGLIVEVYGGYYKMPSELFKMGDKDLTFTPPHLEGSMRGLSAGFEVSEDYSASLHLFKVEAVGSGQWERADTPAKLTQNGVTGTALGKTTLNLEGFMVVGEKRFWRGSDPVRPYVQLGGGVGSLKAEFSGEFNGHETLSGFDFPVKEPANDLVQRTVPVVHAELGLRMNPVPHIGLFLAGYWNTGYGAKTGLQMKF